MSLRTEISQWITTEISGIEYPQPILVTREPFEVTEIAITQFPAVLITSTSEVRETITMGAPSLGLRRGTIDYTIRGFVRGTELDRQRNELIEAIEERLDQQRYLDSSAVTDSQITEISVIERQPPLAEFLINFRVTYNYPRTQT